MNDTESTGVTRRGAEAGTARADDTSASADKLVVYPIPTGVPTNSSYLVKARTPGGEWPTVPVHRARAKQVNADTGSGPVFNSSVNAEGLPTGLDIDTATGLISGTAQDNVGGFTVTVSATNSAGTATQNRTLTVRHA